MKVKIKYRWTDLMKVKMDCNDNYYCGFLKLVSHTVFQSSFLLSVTFGVMHVRHIWVTQSCDFVVYK